jgi:plasmid stabilization system protein ParE
LKLKHNFTKKAEDDLADILDYGIDKYGLKIAVAYYDSIIKMCDVVANRPQTFPKFDHLYPKIRRAKSGVHNIYFIEADGKIIIGRVLHLRAEYNYYLK